jgi:AcrR family transcriptional regulator
MARTRHTPEQRRAEIVAAAARLFAERGYAATSVRDIRDAVGIAQGTFYWHFPSKEAVVDAVVEAYSARTVESVAAVIADPSLGTIERFVRVRDDAFARFAVDRDVLEAFHGPEHAEVHSRVAAATRRLLVPHLARFVGDGVAEGLFTAADPDAAAIFVARCAEAIDAELLLAESDGAPRYADALTEFVLRGLGYTGPLPPYERRN